MMFFKLWKHDLDYGLLRKMVFYVLLGFGQAFLFCRGFSSWAAAMSSIPDVGELTETFGNHLLYLFQGIDEYIPSPDEPFDFPSMWMKASGSRFWFVPDGENTGGWPSADGRL